MISSPLTASLGSTGGLPRPRSGYDWRAEPEYTRIRSQIWDLLESQLEPLEAVPA